MVVDYFATCLAGAEPLAKCLMVETNVRILRLIGPAYRRIFTRHVSSLNIEKPPPEDSDFPKLLNGVLAIDHLRVTCKNRMSWLSLLEDAPHCRPKHLMIQRTDTYHQRPFVRLSNFDRLQTMYLGNIGVYVDLTRMPLLNTLCLEGCCLNLAVLHSAALRRLTVTDCTSNDAFPSDDQLCPLGLHFSCPHLTSMISGNSNIDPFKIAGQPSLIHLEMEFTVPVTLPECLMELNLRGSCVATLPNLPALTALSFHAVKSWFVVVTSDIARAAPNLELLDLSESKIDSLEPLTQLLSLRELYLRDSEFEEADAHILSRLTRLSVLDFSHRNGPGGDFDGIAVFTDEPTCGYCDKAFY
jgi:hypothetical protein